MPEKSFEVYHGLFPHGKPLEQHLPNFVRVQHGLSEFGSDGSGEAKTPTFFVQTDKERERTSSVSDIARQVMACQGIKNLGGETASEVPRTVK